MVDEDFVTITFDLIFSSLLFNVLIDLPTFFVQIELTET